MNPRYTEYEALCERIHGWMPPSFTRVVAAIDDAQRDAGLRGDVAEIGVHCGRSFFPLVLMLRGDERAFAIDCFEDWAANPERSGGASRSQFEASIPVAGVDAGKIIVVQADTKAIPHPLLGCCGLGRLRVVSIDGDHSVIGTLADLWAAHEAMGFDGVVIVDDAWNSDWPGVSCAVHRFLQHPQAPLVGALCGFGKIVLARPMAAEALQRKIKEGVHGLKPVREQTFYGRPILSVTAS